MKSINPELKEHESLIIYGFSSRTCNKDEMNSENAKIPKLWGSFAKSPIKNSTSGAKAFAVYSHYESDVSGFYDITVGIPLHSEVNDLTSITIQKGDYLCFQNQGDFPDVVIETWNTIWGFFNKHPEYTRAYQTDFEMYLDNNAIEVYIGIIK